MIDGDNISPTMGEASDRFLAKLSAQERNDYQPEVYKFARWYGRDRPFARMTAPEAASYADQISTSDADYTRKLEMIRSFLVFGKKEGWSRNNLAVHLKARRAKAGQKVVIRRNLPETVSLTQQKFEELQQELADLKDQSRELIEQIRLAAADKDFRENAPLAAAREQRGHVEGRIKELEEALKSVTIIGGKKGRDHKTSVGDKILLCNLASGEETCYMIVDPREVDPIKGKISLASPLGKALLGRKDGDEVKIKVPAGELCYRIKRVDR